MNVVYLPDNTTTGAEQRVPLTFRPTGDIDTTKTPLTNIQRANTLLDPTIKIMRTVTTNVTFDVWKFINWIMVSHYWLYLYDFGQLAPVGFASNGQYLPKLYEPFEYSESNNIFFNDTLFKIYSSYLQDIIIPVISRYETTVGRPEFLSLGDNNRLVPIDVSFLRRYSCVERRMKGWLSVAISVLIAEYTFIFGAYSCVKLVCGWIQERKDNCIISIYFFLFVASKPS